MSGQLSRKSASASRSGGSDLDVEMSSTISQSAAQPQDDFLHDLGPQIPENQLDEHSHQEDYAAIATEYPKPESGLWGPLWIRILGEPKPIVAVILQVVVSALSSGIVYGWPAVVFMLNAEGAYKELCADANNPVESLPANIKCAARNLQYSTIYNVGVALSVASYLWYGLAVDRLGPLYTNMISTTLAVVGLVVFGISSSALPLYILGYALIGASGVGVHLSSFHLGNRFPAHKGLVLSLYAGIFNVSGIVFAILNLIYSTAGVSLRFLFIGHAVLLLLVSLIVPWYQTKNSLPPPPPPVNPAGINAGKEDKSARGGRLKWSEFFIRIGKSPLPKFNQVDECLPQLKQPMFWYMTVWVVIHLVRISFYAGTVTTQMAYFGDSDGTFGRVAAWTIPLVPLVTFPIVGRMMDRFGLLMTIPLANVFQILFGLLSLVPVLGVQPITFIVYALGRQFFFGTYFALVMQMFGQRHFGKISGTALFVAGIFVVAQIPLVSVIDRSLNGNFALVNLIETLIFLPLFHFIYYIYRKGSE